MPVSVRSVHDTATPHLRRLAGPLWDESARLALDRFTPFVIRSAQDFINQRTGRLGESLERDRARSVDGSTMAEIYSELDYAPVLEYGLGGSRAYIEPALRRAAPRFTAEHLEPAIREKLREADRRAAAQGGT